MYNKFQNKTMSIGFFGYSQAEIQVQKIIDNAILNSW